LWGLPHGEKAAIFAGLEADTLRWLNLYRYPRLPFFYRWMTWHYWHLHKQKEWFISQTVKEINSSVNQMKKNENCVVTAAVFANPSFARYRFAQNWPHWGDNIDYPVIMSYTQDIYLFKDFLDFALVHRPNAIFGIGLLWPDMEAEANWQENKVKENLGIGICYFDYTNLDTLVDLDKLRSKSLSPEESLFTDTTRFNLLRGAFRDRAKPDLIERGKELLQWGEELEFASFLLSLSMNPQRDLIRINVSRERFLREISDDVAAFKTLDAIIFPLGDSLIEPPQREVHYEFLPWADEDTTLVIEKAKTIKKLTQHICIYPQAMDKLIRAAFTVEKSKRKICLTKTGVYVYEVSKIHKNGKQIKKNAIRSELLPIYVNWTIKKRFQSLLH
jgi:hypothetical protein